MAWWHVNCTHVNDMRANNGNQVIDKSSIAMTPQGGLYTLDMVVHCNTFADQGAPKGLPRGEARRHYTQGVASGQQ
jgi:hypothetical protein